MKYFKSLISFIFPLFMMLASFSIYLLVNKVVDNYKEKVANDYSIIIITNEPVIDFDRLSSVKFKRIDKIDRSIIIDDLKTSISKVSFDTLTNNLPYFYEAYLESIPTNEELKKIKMNLTKIEVIQEVEIFETDHTNLYSLLILTKKIVIILFMIVLTSSFIMLFQQIKILFYEYSERISILQLLGASLIYSTKDIVRIILISIVISLMSVFSLLFIVSTNLNSVLQMKFLHIVPTFEDMYYVFLLIVIIGFIIPFIAFGSLILKHRITNDI